MRPLVVAILGACAVLLVGRKVLCGYELCGNDGTCTEDVVQKIVEQ